MARIAALTAALILVASGAWAQDWRGNGRLVGKVLDEQGKGLEGVIVRASLSSFRGVLAQGKTDKRGEWSIDDVAEGNWDVTFERDGYVPAKGSAEVDESGRSSALRITLKKAFDPNAFIQEEGKKAAALMDQKKYAEARAVYEGVVAKVPEVSAQIQPFLARAWYMEGKPEKAVECLRAGLAKDPNSQQMKLLLVSMLLETGALDDAGQMLGAVDEKIITDPTVYLNFGLSLMKKQKANDAIPYFDKAVARFPTSPESHYYHALGLVELVNAEKDPKNPERLARLGKIKADLTTYLQLAPGGSEVGAVKALLEQIDKQMQQK